MEPTELEIFFAEIVANKLTGNMSLNRMIATLKMNYRVIYRKYNDWRTVELNRMNSDPQFHSDVIKYRSESISETGTSFYHFEIPEPVRYYKIIELIEEAIKVEKIAAVNSNPYTAGHGAL